MFAVVPVTLASVMVRVRGRVVATLGCHPLVARLHALAHARRTCVSVDSMVHLVPATMTAVRGSSAWWVRGAVTLHVPVEENSSFVRQATALDGFEPRFCANIRAPLTPGEL